MPSSSRDLVFASVSNQIVHCVVTVGLSPVHCGLVRSLPGQPARLVSNLALILSLVPYSNALSSFRGRDPICDISSLSLSSGAKNPLTLYHNLLPIQASVEASLSQVCLMLPAPFQVNRLVRIENFQSIKLNPRSSRFFSRALFHQCKPWWVIHSLSENTLVLPRVCTLQTLTETAFYFDLWLSVSLGGEIIFFCKLLCPSLLYIAWIWSQALVIINGK